MKNQAGAASILVLSIALSACGQGDGSGTTAPASATDSVRTTTEAVALDRKLPRGMEINFPYHLLRDQSQGGDPGMAQRRVRVEYLDLDRDHVIEVVRDDFTAAGYQPPTQRQLDNGNTQLRFEHESVDFTVRVTVQEGGDLEHVRANGIVFLTFPPRTQSGSGEDDV